MIPFLIEGIKQLDLDILIFFKKRKKKMGNCSCFKLKHHPSKVHVKTIEDILNNYLKNYHEDQVSKAATAALPANKKKNAAP